MFITENINPGEMLAELLKWRRVREVATVRFANWKHDKHLCPKLTDRLNAMLTVYRAYGHQVHDVQGFHDNGIDVLMKYEDKDGNERKAGIQIKSEDEFRRWERASSTLSRRLRRSTPPPFTTPGSMTSTWYCVSTRLVTEPGCAR